MKTNFRLTLRAELRTIHAMKFLNLKKVVKILNVFLVLGLSAYPLLTYAFSFWGPPPSKSTSASITNTTSTQSSSKTSSKAESSESSSRDQFWPELRSSFHLDHYTYNYMVRQQIGWFQNHPKWLNRTLTNAAPYMYYVYSQVVKRNLPGELVLLPVIESAYDPFAYSDRGAAGLWQLMPGTATGYGIKEDWWYDGRRDIYASTNAALDYLSYLQNFFNGNWLYTLAAYNAGQGTVQNAINYNAERDRNTTFWSLPLPSATISYVPQLLALAAIIEDPHEYGINLPSLKDGPYFAEVNIGKQINLTTAARMADISVHELYKLNPGYNRWATDPNGPSLLLLPVDKIDQFKTNLAQLPTQPTLTWNHYQVKPGDTLDSIAEQFGTNIVSLQQMNKINANVLRPGQTLLIPKKHASSFSHYNTKPSNYNANKQELALGKQQIVVPVDVGDSLWSLAVKYQVQPSQIRAWNHLPPNTPLQIGQKLVIKLAQKSHASNKLQPSNYSLTKTYKVTSGDTLSAIAHKFGTTTEAIVKLNHLRSNFLRLGQELKIPSTKMTAVPTKTLSDSASKPSTSKPTAKIVVKSKITTATKSTVIPQSASLIHYTIKPGDTLSGIAHAHHVSIEQLKRWNKGYIGKYLRNGQILVIYH